jgi:hypothetical protein
MDLAPMSKNYIRMTSRPKRKNRPETLLRLLMSTSYPHATLADLMFMIYRHAGPEDRETLYTLADEISDIERQFGMYDFIRAVEVMRNGSSITIIIRQLDIDPEAREIVDSNKTHVELARAEFHLPEDSTEFTDLETMSTTLLNMFRTTQREDLKSERSWTLRQRPGAHGNAKLGNLSVPVVEEKIDTATANALISTSLSKKRFHMVFTHNTILLFDQQRSLK